MATLDEVGFVFDDLSEEMKLIWMRLEKDGVSATDLKVWIKTKKQLLPNAKYDFAIEEVEDDNGKLVGIQLLIS